MIKKKCLEQIFPEGKKKSKKTNKTAVRVNAAHMEEIHCFLL